MLERLFHQFVREIGISDDAKFLLLNRLLVRTHDELSAGFIDDVITESLLEEMTGGLAFSEATHLSLVLQVPVRGFDALVDDLSWDRDREGPGRRAILGDVDLEIHFVCGGVHESRPRDSGVCGCSSCVRFGAHIEPERDSVDYQSDSTYSSHVRRTGEASRGSWSGSEQHFRIRR